MQLTVSLVLSEAQPLFLLRFVPAQLKVGNVKHKNLSIWNAITSI